MRIRALANGNVIDAHEDAAKILIANKIYEAMPDDEPVTASLTPPVPSGSTAVEPMTTASMPTKKGKAKK